MNDKERIRNHRESSGAVGDIGIIETGLSFQRAASKKSIDSLFKPGCVQLTKCEAHKSSLAKRFKLFRNRITQVSSSGEGDGNKTLLHPMKISIPEGSITAILGTADSGKSTLMKFIAGCLDKNVEWDGIVNLPGTKSLSPQDTVLHGYTPRTYIKHYDRLLSNGSSKLMSDKDIENLLDSLRIDRERRDVRVGDLFRRGLTLGEQRRLELGLLVLSAPDTIFCENPVQGLDSETSLHIMEFLKGYSVNSSRRVIVTLNRPSNFIWNLIDNVVLLSRGRVVFEGARFDMESFFATNNAPTPKRFSPIEHYLSVVNDFRSQSTTEDWEARFQEWQNEADDDNEGDDLGDDIATCFPSNIPDVTINRNRVTKLEGTSKVWSRTCNKLPELVRRYLGELVLNPGILQVRLAMYTVLSLFLGALFFNLEKDYQESQSINSHAALLFYSSSFYIFMVCATLPFLAIDLQIRDKEVLNGLYHPITHHLAVTICTIPACLILSLVISVIQVNMVGLQNGIHFFLILTLALWCGDALAMFISLLAPHFVIGIVVCAGICGFFMALEGFMLVPSMFPSWLRWTYIVPFHTYVFRSLMFNEFHGDALGEKVLQSYEIDMPSIGQDMVVIFCYGLAIHFLSALKIMLFYATRMAKKIKSV